MKAPEWPEVGEMISLAISSLLIFCIVGYLTYDIFQNGKDELRPVRAYPVYDTAKEVDGGYIMGIRVENRAKQTIPRLQVHVDIDGEGSKDSRDIEIFYLGGRTHRDFYLYLDNPVRKESVTVRPGHYSLQ